MISIAIASVLIALLAACTAVMVASLKYKESAELGAVQAELAALRKEVKSSNPKEMHDRIVALEGRAGIRMF